MPTVWLVWLAGRFGPVGLEPGDGDGQLGVAQGRELLACRTTGGDGSQALLGVAAVLLDVHGRHRLDRGTAVGVQTTLLGQVVGQWPRLVARPGLERRDELSLIDEPDLKRDQPEQEMVFGTCHVVAPVCGS